jgi:hypothetical protein
MARVSQEPSFDGRVAESELMRDSQHRLEQ